MGNKGHKASVLPLPRALYSLSVYLSGLLKVWKSIDEMSFELKEKKDKE